jgi:bacterial/archaeal transporter family-2 protein
MTSSRIEPSRLTVAITVACALVFGAGVATQSRINGELGRGLDDGYLAAVISFGGGLVILTIAMLFSATGRAGLRAVVAAVRGKSMPWFYVAGGAAGAFLVLSQGLTAAILGVALFTVAIVSGQTLSGLAIDRRGLGTMQPKKLTVTRVLGSALTLVAVGIAVSAQITGDIPVWMLVMPFLAGIGIGWQQAVNGQVRVRAGSALTATFINFVVGFTVLAVAAIIHGSVVGWPTSAPTEWWLYLGGPIGVVFIAGAAIAVRILGVLLLGLATIAGQLVMSLVLDVVVPSEGHVVVATTVIGTLLTLVAVAIAGWPQRSKTTGAK